MPTITTNYKGDMLFETTIGRHKMTIDVPSSMGGKDRGPVPPEVFVASLGSCIGAFIAEYCKNTGINSEGLSVDLTFDKADDPTRLVNLKATVNLPKGDCSKRVTALERVARHCPVHETISTMQGLDVTILGEGQCTMNP
ncbi:MAG: OsmC family protein [Dehalococcoidales bacterium]|nr:OsmC family protein [Dehalococcoidales bacterium]